MSLKFAALGSLTVLGALGTSARADDRLQNLQPVEPYERILITFGRKSSVAEPTRPEAGARVRDGKLNAEKSFGVAYKSARVEIREAKPESPQFRSPN